MIAMADHFEPAITHEPGKRYMERDVQEQGLERWCKEYPKMAEEFRDCDGYTFRHTYFYPAEQYDACLVERLAEHCHAGWGEIEIHLHHGMDAPDTAENTRRLLLEYRDRLVAHGCLSRVNGAGDPQYAFVHGNFALANGGGWFCGVDNELEVLADTGCYADFTFPSAPNVSQPAKINAIYECSLPLSERAAYRRGEDLRVGRAPTRLPIIVQGPLGINFGRRAKSWGLPHPCIENSAVASSYPAAMDRFKLWRHAAITVAGRPDWIFIKLHCHGIDPRDEDAMMGSSMRRFLQELLAGSEALPGYQHHFVTAREMANIIFAACDGREGNPGHYRDYRMQLGGSSAAHRAACQGTGKQNG